MAWLRSLLLGLCLPLAGVALALAAEPLTLPSRLEGKAVVLTPGDSDYPRADLPAAVKTTGEGGLIQGLAVRLTSDIPVWRMWSGPAKKDARGNTNRLGQWWSYDPPQGTQQDYRQHYEICLTWNDLTWVVQCTLKQGAIVAIGPGNAVSAPLCGDPTGKEAYPANPTDWQVWIAQVWNRLGPDKELDCPAESNDYEADPADISHTKAAASR